MTVELRESNSAVDTAAPAGSAGADGSSHKTLRRNLGALAGGQLTTWTMTVVFTVTVPRLIGPVHMGMLTAAWSTAALLGAVLGLGTKQFLSREIVARPEEQGALLGAGFLMRLATIPIFFGAAIAYAVFTHLGHESAIVLLVATLAVSLTFPMEPLQAYFQATERMQFLAYGDVWSKTAQAAAGVGIALLGFGAVGVSLTSAAAYALVLILSLSWASRFTRMELRPTTQRMKEVIAGSARYWVLALFLMIYIWVDTVMLSRMAPLPVVAWYGAATRLFQALMFVPTILITAWLPRMVSAHELSPGLLHRAARAPTELVVVLGLPIAIATAMTAGPAVRLIYGPGYEGAATPLVWLACCLPLVYLNTVLANIYVAAKRPLAWSRVMALACVVNPLLNVFLIRYFQEHHANGATGAGISLFATELIISVIGVIAVGRKVLDRSSLLRMGRIAVAGAGMWIVMYEAQRLELFLLGFVGIAAYVLLSAVLRVVTPEERRIIWAHLPGRRGRGVSPEFA